MHIFNKYESHACLIEHIFKNVYGEKPSCAKEKPRRGDFANVALNSYNFIKMIVSCPKQKKKRVGMKVSGQQVGKQRVSCPKQKKKRVGMKVSGQQTGK